MRYAVRAVTEEQGRFLMIHSTTDGDYKFPGGGVQRGENHATALARELREEAGRSPSRITALLGITIELDIAPEHSRGNFRMVSFYYLCELDPGIHPQSLDRYEKTLGFTPAWVTPKEALDNNVCLYQRADSHGPFWLAREIAVLRELSAMRCISGLSH